MARPGGGRHQLKRQQGIFALSALAALCGGSRRGGLRLAPAAFSAFAHICFISSCLCSARERFEGADAFFGTATDNCDNMAKAIPGATASPATLFLWRV